MYRGYLELLKKYNISIPINSYKNFLRGLYSPVELEKECRHIWKTWVTAQIDKHLRSRNLEYGYSTESKEIIEALKAQYYYDEARHTDGYVVRRIDKYHESLYGVANVLCHLKLDDEDYTELIIEGVYHSCIVDKVTGELIEKYRLELDD